MPRQGGSLPCTWAAPHPVTHQAATGRFWEAGAEAGTTALAKRKAAEPSNAGLETETRWEANARTPVTTRRHAARGRGRYPRGRLGAGSRAPAAASRAHHGRTPGALPAWHRPTPEIEVRFLLTRRSAARRAPRHAGAPTSQPWRTAAEKRHAGSTSPPGSAEGNGGDSSSSSQRRGGDGHVPPAAKGAECRAGPGGRGNSAGG